MATLSYHRKFSQQKLLDNQYLPINNSKSFFVCFKLSLGLKLRFLSLQRKQSMCAKEEEAKGLDYVKFIRKQRRVKKNFKYAGKPIIYSCKLKESLTRSIKNSFNYAMYIFFSFLFFERAKGLLCQTHTLLAPASGLWDYRLETPPYLAILFL